MSFPERYARNIGTIGEQGQERLAAACVAIAGAGGLGGTVFEILVRAGVGIIIIIDFDCFEESNLNRQLLSTMPALGTSKVQAAIQRAAAVNPDVTVEAHEERLTDANAAALLRRATLVCDCLGNIRDRFIVERAARTLRIPMVHAAVAGARGQILTVFPETAGLEAIYGSADAAPDAGDELALGTPPSTVIAVAALQAHEAIKILAGRGEPLSNELLRLDLDAGELRRFEIPSMSK